MFVGLIVFVGIQLVPTKRNQSSDVLETDFNEVFKVSNNLQSIIKNSCYDCHSNNTNYPWYNKIQPVSWFLEKHINEGKKELNFSTFGDYSKRKQKSKLKSIINQIRDDKMPLKSYTLIHRNTKLNELQKKEVIEWFTKLKDSV
ncbi:heme-binding protein [Lutibacter oceani]|uniref:Heme-binding protein n=2 Tax=Lutibacter oceani TaxID=1853311 RepID=A0A3D9RK83_9FLAO|nr:heme-binding protein [Lutibacter oceani]